MVAQKFIRPENRNSRLELAVTAEMTPNPLEAVTLEAGLLNCGVFVRLNASARKTRPNRSAIVKARAMLTLKFVRPGPRSECSPAVPKRHTAVLAAEQLDPDVAFSASGRVSKIGRIEVRMGAVVPAKNHV